MLANMSAPSCDSTAALELPAPQTAGATGTGYDSSTDKAPQRGIFPPIRSATRAQCKLALMISIGMIVGATLLIPFARIPWRNLPELFSVYQTAVIVTSLITAYLMYGHYKATRAVAIVHLGAGYLYAAGVMGMQLAWSNGTLSDGSWLTGGPQTAIWLWILWHLGLASSLLFYAVNEYARPGWTATGRRSELEAATGLLLALGATALLVFVFHDRLPLMEVEGNYNRITTSGLAPALELILAAALAVLWWASRFRRLLHAWLGLVLVALLCDNALTMVAGHRLTLGWYLGRAGSFMAFSVMVLVYLHEIKEGYLHSIAVADQLAFSNSQLDSEIAERRRYTEKLVEADHRKDEFLVMLAHELRNPLAPISAAAELLSIGHPDDGRIKKTSKIISRQVKQMTSLVDDLLDVSRVTRGLAVLNEVPLDAKQVIADAVEQAGPLIEERHHQLETRLLPEPVFILGDHDRMVQVITNLLNNSAKYTKPGGKILLRLELRGAEVIFAVSDNGMGMSPELVNRAFMLFSQGELTPDRSHGGLGIGLALVKSLVELHRGYVYAKSQGPGLGSEFGVVLPRIATPPGVIDASGEIAAQSGAAPSRRLMVVDDDADAANTLALFLEACGHSVAIEHVSRLVVERARIERPDVCLLDIEMPDMDGTELAQRLRQQPETRHCMLIAVSGHGEKSMREKAAEAGFDHYLVKPIDTARLGQLLFGLAGKEAGQ
jgi:signal transduction histidine kinase/ActR/RegA family two-component response regulator